LQIAKYQKVTGETDGNRWKQMFFRHKANLGFHKPCEMIFRKIFFTKVCSVQKFSLSLHLSSQNAGSPRATEQAGHIHNKRRFLNALGLTL